MKTKFGFLALAMMVLGAALYGCGGGGSDYGSSPRDGGIIEPIPDTGTPISAPTDTSITEVNVNVSPEFDPASNSMDLYFYVTDQDGNRLELFNKHNFQVTVNGVAHVSNSDPETVLGTISGVESHTVALGLDESGSMESEVSPGVTSMDVAKKAAKLFVDRMTSTDKTAVVAFSTEARILKAVTKDKASLKAAIDTLEPTAATNIGDCIIKTVNVLGAYPGKTAAVVMTDGGDTEGQVEAGIKVAKDAGMPVFTIGFGSGIDEDNLRHIADSTGGVYFPASAVDLDEVFTVDLPAAIDELPSRTSSVYHFKYPLGRVQWPASEEVVIQTIFTFENALGKHQSISMTQCQVIGR